MADISEIVNVNISRQTQAVTRLGFGTALFVGRNYFFGERVREYSSLTQMVEDGVPVNSAEYQAGAAYFGQEVSPEKLLLGRQAPTNIKLVPDVADSETYSVEIGTVNVPAVTISVVSDGDATATEIVDALVTAIDADPTIGSLVVPSNASDKLNLVKEGADEIVVKGWSSNFDVEYTSSESLVEAITACSEERDDWYGLATYSHADADISSVAAYIETLNRIYGYSSGAPGIITTGSSDIMATLQAASYARTFGIYDVEAGDDTADTDGSTVFSEMAWIGAMFPTDPGSATWMFKTLAGVTPDNITGTQSTNVRDKHGNTYETIQGVNMIREGQMASGEYIDIIRGADWLEARMEERIFSRLANLPKIPYTDAGVAIIENEIRAQLLEGIAAGYISGEEEFTITVPKVRDVSDNDKINRSLPPIKFVAILAGAIHRVTVNGVVTV